MFQVILLCLLLGSVQSFTLSKKIFDRTGAPIEKNQSGSGAVGRVFAHTAKANNTKEDDFGISALLEEANKNLGKSPNGPEIIELDIVVGHGLQNADLCTASECRWPKHADGNVYVPFVMSDKYAQNMKRHIEFNMHTISRSTCIRFIPRTTQRDYIYIDSGKGCSSMVGRKGGRQIVTLETVHCTYRSAVQHEMFHVLGFHHEHSRSDRDQHVKIIWENIEKGKEKQFIKIQTNNLNTPYDYGSIMQYRSTFFSKNGQPTMVPIPNANVPMGEAIQMSKNDILRVNRLYCSGGELEDPITMEE